MLYHGTAPPLGCLYHPRYLAAQFDDFGFGVECAEAYPNSSVTSQRSVRKRCAVQSGTGTYTNAAKLRCDVFVISAVNFEKNASANMLGCIYMDTEA